MTKPTRTPNPSTGTKASKRSTARRDAKANPPSRLSRQAAGQQTAPMRANPAPSTTTIRLRPEVRKGLEFLHDKLGGTMNKLVNDGLAAYVQMRTAALDQELRSALEEIKKLREADPLFTKDFAEVARAEAMYAADDPAQGKAKRRRKGDSAVAMVRGLIGSTR